MLILDSHVTHTKNLAATDMAVEAGVAMVSLPPHTTHRLQPLDVAFFGPFGKYCDDALRMWMRGHVGRPVTTWQVAGILNVAYIKAASIQNAVSGFRKAGRLKLTIYVFQDSDFAVAMVTNVITEAAHEHNHTPPLTPVVAAPALTAVAMVTAQEHNPTPPLTPVVAVPALTAVAMVTAQEHNSTPPLTPVVAAPALTAVAMEAVPETCPPKKDIVKQSKVGPEKARPSTYKTTPTQSRAHNSSDPPKPSRLQLIKDAEGCRTGQWCTIGIPRHNATSDGYDERNCVGAVHVNCGTEQVPMVSEG